MAHFNDLPAEVTDLIATLLDNSDLCTFRLTSRRCQWDSLPAFVRRIKLLRFLVAPHSLAALLAISQHKYIGRKIDTLHLGVHYLNECFAKVHFEDALCELDLYDDSAGQVTVLEQREKFYDYLSAQRRFREGHDIAMLTAILVCLSNMQHIEVSKWTHRGDGAQWRCYGMAVTEAETGYRYDPSGMVHDDDNDDMRQRGPSRFGLHHNFMAVLQALSLSRRQVESLSAHIWPEEFSEIMWESGSIDLEAMESLTGYYADGLRAAFRRLSRLSLSVSWSEAAPDHRSIAAKSACWLSDFVSLAPQLQILSITHQDPLESARLNFGKFWRHAYMPCLTKFELQNAVVHEADMANFLGKYSCTLADITLRYVSLVRSRWADVMLRIKHDLGDLDLTLKLAWLVELENPDPMAQDYVYLVFDEDGFTECWCYRNQAGRFNMHECKHISRTICWNEIELLQGFQRLHLREFRLLYLRH